MSNVLLLCSKAICIMPDGMLWRVLPPAFEKCAVACIREVAFVQLHILPLLWSMLMTVELMAGNQFGHEVSSTYSTQEQQTKVFSLMVWQNETVCIKFVVKP